jgi:uncharacterized protein (DUF2147 family)
MQTFGEIKVGQKFITAEKDYTSIEGQVFIKTAESKESPTTAGWAINLCNGETYYFYNEEYVIHVYF